MSELSYEELLDHIQEQRPPDAGLSATDRGGAGGTRYRRVGGSSLGGSSFWGLVRLP